MMFSSSKQWETIVLLSRTIVFHWKLLIIISFPFLFGAARNCALFRETVCFEDHSKHMQTHCLSMLNCKTQNNEDTFEKHNHAPRLEEAVCNPQGYDYLEEIFDDIQRYPWGYPSYLKIWKDIWGHPWGYPIFKKVTTIQWYLRISSMISLMMKDIFEVIHNIQWHWKIFNGIQSYT